MLVYVDFVVALLNCGKPTCHTLDWTPVSLNSPLSENRTPSAFVV